MISLLKDLDNPCHKLKKRIKGMIEFKIKEGQQSTSPLRDEEKSSHFIQCCATNVRSIQNQNIVTKYCLMPCVW